MPERRDDAKMGMVHAFIGPNDSGKSTILRAVGTLSSLANKHSRDGSLPVTSEFNLAARTPAGNYDAGLTNNGWTIPVAPAPVAAALRARLLRLDPDELRQPSPLIPDNGAIDFANERGRGLPGVYDAIVNRGDDSFTRIRTPNQEREVDIERAIEAVVRERSLRVAGGVAIEALEGWLIAIAGEVGSESVRHPEKEMGRLGLVAKSAASYADHIEQNGLGRIAADAASLLRWVDRARDALAP